MKKTFGLLLACTALIFSGCQMFQSLGYSVFSGACQGTVVDAESTANPKAGIANVDVYFYTDKEQRDADMTAWKPGETFTSRTEYHTTTGANGTFNLPKLIWTNTHPKYGKDGDVTTCYLVFYHENYGLTDGQTIIVSDSSTSNICKELKAIRKSTDLTINLVDVASGRVTGNTLFVEVTVPQLDNKTKTFSQSITGSGNIIINYPRYTDSTQTTEFEPEITLTYAMTGDANDASWIACQNPEKDSSATDYSFKADSTMKVKVSGTSQTIECYGKSTELSIPAVSGQFTAATGTESDDDGIVISMMAATDGTNFTLDCGETTTEAQTIGTNGNFRHGMYQNLGNGITWSDKAYTGKYTNIKLQFYKGKASSQAPVILKNKADGQDFVEVRSDTGAYTFNLVQ